MNFSLSACCRRELHHAYTCIALRILSSTKKSTSLCCLPAEVYSRTREGTSSRKVWRGDQPRSRLALSDDAQKWMVLHSEEIHGHRDVH
jgi:hypothetical protein